jgi:hypothetical protein
MFNLFRKSQPRRPTAALSQELVREGLPPGTDPLTLLVVTRHGSYSGRGVSYFRVFDEIRVAERPLDVRNYADLDTHADLVLGSGHLEGDGTVVLSKRHRSSVPVASARTEADRSAHDDDKQFVFPGEPGH